MSRISIVIAFCSACGGGRAQNFRDRVVLKIEARPSENLGQFGAEVESRSMQDRWDGVAGVLSIEANDRSASALLLVRDVQLHTSVDRRGAASTLIRPNQETKAAEARDTLESMGEKLAASGWHNVVPIGDYWRHLLDNDCKGDHRLTHDWHMGPPSTKMPKASIRMSIECQAGLSSPSRWALMLTFESAIGE